MSIKSKIYYSVLIVIVLVCYSSIYLNMGKQWADDPNYSHGYLVPLLSIYYVWQIRDDLRVTQIKPSLYGLFVVIFSVFTLFVGIAAQEFYTQRSSLIFLLSGTVLFLYGFKIFKKLTLPIGFLFFMIPLPYIIYDAIAFPLKLFVAKFSVLALKLMNVIVLREGNIIMFPHTVLEVADACSGLRSLMSLLTLGVALAVISQRKKGAAILLVALTIPIAVITNMVRVIGTGFLAQYYGTAAAEGFFHEFAGMGVFILAMVMLFVSSGFLRKVWC